MEKTEALERIEWLAALRLPCGISDWRQAVIENPNFMQKEYDHLVKFEAIPEEVHTAYFDELHLALKPLEDVLWAGSPSKGIIYMVMHPEYQAEWEEQMKRREGILETQKEDRLKIHKRMHRKYYYEYGISFNPNTYHF